MDRITTVEPLTKVLNIISKVGSFNPDDKRISISSDRTNLILSSSIFKSLWVSYSVPAEGVLPQELELDPDLFKVAIGSGHGIAIEVVDHMRAFITDSDRVTTECPTLIRGCLPKPPKAYVGIGDLVPVRELLEPFSWVYRAISKDAGRPHLNVMLLSGRRAVTTDGHRLHVAPIPFDVGEDSLICFGGVRALIEIFKTVSKNDVVTVSGSDTVIIFEVGPWSVTCQFPDVRFPPYKKVIPNPWERSDGLHVTLDSGKLLKTMKKAQKILKGSPYNKVIIQPTVDNSVQIVAENSNKNCTVRMHVPAVVRGNPGFHVGVDVKYVIDALTGSGDVEIFIGKRATTPANHSSQEDRRMVDLDYTTESVVFSSDIDQFAVVMPQRP